MKRLATNVSICLVSFAIGVAAASILNWMLHSPPVDYAQVAVVKDQPPSTDVPGS